MVALIISKNVTFLGIVINYILYIIEMLFEGQGNAEERPEYQIMIKRKGSNLYNVINLS